jgi:hypothetical protein
MRLRRPRKSLPTTLGLLLALLLVPLQGTVLAQTPCPAPTQVPGVDNRDGYQVLFEEPPIHPLELSPNGRELWAVSIPDAGVSVFSVDGAGNLAQIKEIPVCLGPVTVRWRPGVDSQPGEPGGIEQPDGEGSAELESRPAEVWVACHSSNSVAVINARSRRVLTTIRVPFEPADIVFNDDYSIAYVALSASNQVARIDAATRTVLTPTIEVQSEIPPNSDLVAHVEEPRSLLLDGDTLYALSFKSGNGTIPDEFDLDGDGDTADILDWWTVVGSNPPPPDRDVLAFDVNFPGAVGTNSLWRLGTLNFDLLEGPFGDLYVSNVELLNAAREHKFDYKLNGFSNHRITYGPPSATGVPPTPSTVIDLNRPGGSVHPGLPADYRCAVPNEMAFSGDQRLLYVACQDTDNTAVVDVSAPGAEQVIAQLTANTGFGPRGLVLLEAKGRAYVYNRGDDTIDAFAIPVATGSTSTPVQTVSAGFDITPANVLAGRRHFLDASNSVDGLGNCNTCHMDGRLDGLAWDLADFTGDLPAAPEPRDDNAIKVTMDLSNIEQTPPFHWQGNRDDLVDFNAAFDGLLGGQLLGPQQFVELQDFIFRISYPPNLNQDPERIYSTEAVAGAGCFTLLTAHTVSRDATEYPSVGGTPSFNVTCADCHSLDGFAGTNNQVNNDVRGLLAEDGTHLLGMFDKESDTVFYGAIGIPAIGYGFSNPGTVDTIAQFVDIFQLFNATQRGQITTFLEEFDSNMAPSTAFAWTLNRASAGPSGTVPTVPVLSYQIPQAIAGHSDLVVRGWLRVAGAVTDLRMRYNPTSGMFDTSLTGLGPFTFAQLVSQVQNGDGVLTFVGTPVDSGYRLGRDADMDQLLDNDEPALGTSAANPDSDGDGYPDGYEVRIGSNPTSPGSIPTGDVTAPVISGETLRWVNSQVAKISWDTDEESDSVVDVLPAGGGTPLWSGFEPQLKKRHTMVVRGLDPGVNSYDLVIRATDPVGNTGTSTVLTGTGGATTQPHLFQSVHVSQTALTVVAINVLTGQILLRADFTVVDENNAPVGGATVAAKLVEWLPGSGTNLLQTGTTGPSNAVTGVASVNFTTTNTVGTGFTAEVTVDLSNPQQAVVDSATNRHYFHPLDGEFNYWAQLTGL